MPMSGEGRRRVEIPDYLLGGVIDGVARSVYSLQHAGRRVPDHVLAAHRWLSIMSAAGHETDCDEPRLDEDDRIGTAEAAILLGCSARHVRRIQADLDGARSTVGNTWWFSRRTVIRYRDGRKDKAS